MPRKISRLVLAAALALAACLTVAAVALGGAPAKRTRAQSASAAAHAAAARGLAELAPDVAALRAVREPSDAVTDQLVQSPLLADGVADPALSRRVGFSKPAWLLPATDGRSVCVLTNGSLSCPLAADVVDHGLAPSVTWSADGPIRIAGIASDQVSSAEVVESDGSVRTVEISGNLLDYSSEHPPRAVRWTGPDGPHTFAIPEIKGR